MLVHLLIAGEIRHATRAQIVAALPPVLQVEDKPDPQGEARYARVIALARRAYSPEIAKGEAKDADAAARHRAAEVGRPLLVGLEKVLGGSWRIPLSIKDRFPDQASLKSLAKLIAMATKDASERGDKGACERSVRLGLRLSDRLIDAGGDPIDLMVAVATEAIAEKSAVDADAAGTLDDAARRRVLALLPPLGGPMPQLAKAIRNEFYERRMPILLDPVKGMKELLGTQSTAIPQDGKNLPGNFDPLATARLIGAEYAAAMRDSLRPFGKQTNEAKKLAEAATKTYQQPQGASETQMRKLAAKIPNSFGLALATSVSPDSFALVGNTCATRRNLARAAILLRHGEPANLPDPFGRGPLKIDARRRIVYSVGENGKDDGGAIGKGFRADAPDIGYRY